MVAVIAVIHPNDARPEFTRYELWQEGELEPYVSTTPEFESLRIRDGLSVYALGVVEPNRQNGSEIVSVRVSLSRIPAQGTWIRYHEPVPEPWIIPEETPSAANGDELARSLLRHERQQAVRRAEEALQFKARPVSHRDRSAVVIYPVGGNPDEDGMMIGVHTVPPRLLHHLLSETGANPKRWQLELRTETVDDSRFRFLISSAKAQAPFDAHYHRYLEALGGFFRVRDGLRRELIITAPARDVLHKEVGASDGLAKAQPLSPDEWGTLVEATQCRTTWPPPEGDSKMHPMRHAHVTIRDAVDHYTVGHNTTQYVYYVVFSPTTGELRAYHAQGLGGDIIVANHNLGGERLVGRMVIRYSGTPAGIAQFERSLPFRHFERVPGWDGPCRDHLLKLHRSGLPGTPHQLRAPHFTIGDWPDFLSTLANMTNALGDSSGDWPIGHTYSTSTRRVLTINSNKIHAALLLGPTDTGKTVHAIMMAYTLTPYVWTIQLSASPVDWSGAWASQFVMGQNPTLDDLGTPKSAGEFVTMTRALETEVRQRTKELIERCELTGKLEGFPWTVQYSGGNHFLYLMYVHFLLDITLPAIGEFAKKHGLKVALVIDDLIAAGKAADCPVIGAQAPRAAELVRRDLHKLADWCRRWNLTVIGTAHGFMSMIETYGTGFLGDLALVLSFSAKPQHVHQRAEIYYPPDLVEGQIWGMKEPTELIDGEKLPEPCPGWQGFFDPHLDPDMLRILGVPE